MKKIGIIGANGFVGRAMQKLLPDALVFDPSFARHSPYDPAKDQKEINKCDAVFVCVPTNLKADGTLDMSIVEDVVAKCEAPLIIIRSTLQPGFSQYLAEKYQKRISVMPEYVGETVSHPLMDEAKRPFVVIGGDIDVRKEVIEILTTVYNANINIRQVANYAAELIKLCENRAIAFQVMQFHELYKACEAAGVDYYVLRDAVYGDDPRFNLWFSFIFPNNLGFQSSKCLSKDVPAFVAWAKSVGFNADISKLLVKKSKEYANGSKT